MMKSENEKDDVIFVDNVEIYELRPLIKPPRKKYFDHLLKEKYNEINETEYKHDFLILFMSYAGLLNNK